MAVDEKKGLYDVHTIARFLHSLDSNISPVKLHKTLYFLFAYHGAVYRNDTLEGVFEGSSEATSSYLFVEDIEAWKYGPVVSEVYMAMKNDDDYANNDRVQAAIDEIEKSEEIKSFILDLFADIQKVSDFTLIDRSHRDEAWRRAYEQGERTIIDKEQIIQEYVEEYL